MYQGVAEAISLKSTVTDFECRYKVRLMEGSKVMEVKKSPGRQLLSMNKYSLARLGF